MKAPSTEYEKRLALVLRHIENNLDAPLSLEELSGIACFSPFHFHRIFTAMVGESVAAYIRRLLLQRAAQQLSYSRTSVTRVSLDAGYDSLDAFSRAFRALFGMSPSLYRKNGGSPGLAAQRNGIIPVYYNHLTGVYPMDIRIDRFMPRLTAATRHVGAYMDCGPAWERLCGQLAARNLVSSSALAIGICHDDPDVTPPEKCRMEVCVALPDGFTGESPEVRSLLENKDIYLRQVGDANTDYAVARVKGPYTLLHPAYRSLYGEWLPRSGREPAAELSFEIYLSDPSQTPESELLTEIYVPLLPKQ